MTSRSRAKGETNLKKSSILPSGRLVAFVTILASAMMLVWSAAVVADDIVDHPDKLKFKELKYDPPHPKDFRHALNCGATAYIAENTELPIFDLSIIIRTGSMYEPLDKAGLAAMTGYLMRNGGVEGLPAKEIDERLAYLASEI